MSPPSPDRTRTVEDFLGLLGELSAEAIETAVIGGMAVGAYARLMGDALFSADLDLYADNENLQTVLRWAKARGITPTRVPQARAIPVAVFMWNGLEVNVLTRSHGLDRPKDVQSRARAFHFKGHEGLEVLIADPFDLLANKLQVRREKDLPHIAVLQRVVEQEVMRAFREEADPRARLAPARRLLKVTKARTLPEALADRLVELASTPADFRFLMNHVPRAEQAERLLERSAGDAEVARIRKARRFRPQA